MQRQGSFSQVEYGAKKKQTRRDKFLAEMGEGVAWARGRPVLAEGGAGRAADWAGADAADLLLAAMVWAGRRGAGGCAVRQPSFARLCRDRSEPRPGAGRDDAAEVPPLAGAPRTDQSAVRRKRRDVG